MHRELSTEGRDIGDAFAVAITLESTIWEPFVDQCWGKRVAVLDNRFQWPRLSPADLFSNLREFALRRDDAEFRKLTRCSLAYAEHGKHRFLRGRADELLPQDSDLTFEHYQCRLSDRFASSELLIVINDFNLVSRTYFAACLKTLEPVLAPVGLPISEKTPGGSTGIDMSLFLGHARRTPIGVHRDPNHNFLIPIVGRKTIRGWDERSCNWVHEIEGAGVPYRHRIEDSSVVCARDGEVVYWPPSFWHIAEADSAEFSCALAVGVFQESSATSLTPK